MCRLLESSAQAKTVKPPRRLTSRTASENSAASSGSASPFSPWANRPHTWYRPPSINTLRPRAFFRDRLARTSHRVSSRGRRGAVPSWVFDPRGAEAYLTVRRAPGGEKTQLGAVHRRPQQTAGEKCGLGQISCSVVDSFSPGTNAIAVSLIYLVAEWKGAPEGAPRMRKANASTTRLRTTAAPLERWSRGSLRPRRLALHHRNQFRARCLL